MSSSSVSPRPPDRKPSLRDATTTSRRFYLERSRDPSGVSGVGIVADGVEFPSGKCAINWRGSWPSVAVYDSMKHVLAVHGHGGDTQAVFLDEWSVSPRQEGGKKVSTDPQERLVRNGTMSVSEHIKFMQRRHRRMNRLVCLLVGHRYVFGVDTVPPAEIWDCRWCPKSEIRWNR